MIAAADKFKAGKKIEFYLQYLLTDKGMVKQNKILENQNLFVKKSSIPISHDGLRERN